MYASLKRDGRVHGGNNKSNGELRFVLQDVGVRPLRTFAPQDHRPLYRQSIDEDGFYCVPIRDEDLRNASRTKEECVISGMFGEGKISGENL